VAGRYAPPTRPQAGGTIWWARASPSIPTASSWWG
jgi:hypothetical protein